MRLHHAQPTQTETSGHGLMKTLAFSEGVQIFDHNQVTQFKVNHLCLCLNLITIVHHCPCTNMQSNRLSLFRKIGCAHGAFHVGTKMSDLYCDTTMWCYNSNRYQGEGIPPSPKQITNCNNLPDPKLL